ncbi:hypothetical protein LC55x_2757 [Lysobacter capsici]|nr:hypothetical protein LC55x_2757 [Lysobacter capsici]
MQRRSTAKVRRTQVSRNSLAASRGPSRPHPAASPATPRSLTPRTLRLVDFAAAGADMRPFSCRGLA